MDNDMFILWFWLAAWATYLFIFQWYKTVAIMMLYTCMSDKIKLIEITFFKYDLISKE